MSKEQQPESLRLADALENGDCFDVGSSGVAYGWKNNDPTSEAAEELRRLHAENEALKRELIKESARTAAEKRRADQMSLQHSMQAALNKDARDKLARYAAEEMGENNQKAVE